MPPAPLVTVTISARSMLEIVIVTPASPWPSVPKTVPVTVVVCATEDEVGAGVRLPTKTFWPGGGGGTEVLACAGQPASVPLTLTSRYPWLVGRPGTVNEPSAAELAVAEAPPAAVTVTVAAATLAPLGSTTTPLTAVPGSAMLVTVRSGVAACMAAPSNARMGINVVWPAGGATKCVMKGAEGS